LNNAQGNLATSVQRLSSGLRINSARDDASGLAITQTMAGHIKALDQSSLNAQQALNLAQTADTSLSSTQDILLRMQQLAVEGVNGSLSGDQRNAIVTELKNLNDQINAFANGTTYNGIALLGGSGDLNFQVGADPTNYSGDQIKISKVNILTNGSGTATELTSIGTDIAGPTGGAHTNLADAAASGTDADWSSAFKRLQDDTKTAINYISTQRATLGSVMNQLGYINSNLVSQSANEQAARSTVADTNFSAETAQLTKGQIMQQAATAMLAQANQMPNVILSLLK
jgi:flagellin